MDASEKDFSVHRTGLFERCLDDLWKKGGTAEVAAKKALELIEAITDRDGKKVRKKFSFTRHGEARIRNCRKIDLGCGYRLVCLLKDGHLVLLFAGSHDDCSRWLMRNRLMNYEFKKVPQTVLITRDQEDGKETEPLVAIEENQFADAYEAELMSKIDDAVLRKVFSGIVNGRS
jgi:hypothetical protein